MNVTQFNKDFKVRINMRGLKISFCLRATDNHIRILTTWFENYRNPEFIRKYNETEPTDMRGFCLSIRKFKQVFSIKNQELSLTGETLDELANLLLPKLKNLQKEDIELDESYKVVIDNMGDIADLYVYNEYYSYELGEIDYHEFEYFWSYRHKFYAGMEDIQKIGDKIIIERDGKTYNIPISLFERILA